MRYVRFVVFHHQVALFAAFPQDSPYLWILPIAEITISSITDLVEVEKCNTDKSREQIIDDNAFNLEAALWESYFEAVEREGGGECLYSCILMAPRA